MRLVLAVLFIGVTAFLLDSRSAQEAQASGQGLLDFGIAEECAALYLECRDGADPRNSKAICEQALGECIAEHALN